VIECFGGHLALIQAKQKQRENPGNYRSVSLSSVPEKIMEKIILGTVERHLKGNAVIRDSEHGFTKGRSCQSSLISFNDKVTSPEDEGKMLNVAFLDFSKSSGEQVQGVMGEELVEGQSSKGCSKWGYIWLEACPLWFSSVLNSRARSVQYINDLDAGVECKFANSSELGGAVDSLEEQEALQRDLDKLEH